MLVRERERDRLRVMRKIRSRDLDRQARQVTDQPSLDNGRLPHGGYKGSKRHPLSILSFNKGAEFQHNIEQEVDRMLREEQMMPQCATPSWAILLHRTSSHSDESPLLANNLLTVSKLGQTLETKMYNPNSLQSKAWFKAMRDIGRQLYRPNSTHQFLTATDLRDSAEDQVNIDYGRPTRTTLLRDLQRRNSAAANSYHTRRGFLHRLHDLRNSSPTTELFKSVKPPDGKVFHYFLTGARYNRYSTTLGCWFTEVKGQDVHEAETPPLTTRIPKQPAYMASSYRFRPSTTPGHRSRNKEPWNRTETVADILTTPLKLKVVGNNLSIGKAKQFGFKLPNLQSLNSSGKPSRCPEDASLGMYSTRSSNATADSVENVSDSVRNAIIASNDVTDPGGLEIIRKAEPDAEDSERIEKDDTEEKMLENLLRGSSGSLSSVGLPVASLPSDIPASVGQDAGNQAEEEETITIPVHNRHFLEEGRDNPDEILYKHSNATDYNEFGTDFADDKAYGCDMEGGDSDCLPKDADDTKVNNINHYVLEGDEENDNLRNSKEFDNGLSMCFREADAVIKDDNDNGSPEEGDGHKELLGASSVPNDEAATFFITEESLEPGEDVGEQ